MPAVPSWTVDEVCKHLTVSGMSDAVVSAFRGNSVDGKTLLELEKSDLKEELDIAALADRKRTWELIQTLQELQEKPAPAPLRSPVASQPVPSPPPSRSPVSRPSTPQAAYGVGQRVMYRSRSVTGDTPAEVVAVDRSLSPPAYVVRFADGKERSTEALNLSPATPLRSCLRRSSSTSSMPSPGPSPRRASGVSGSGAHAVHQLRDVDGRRVSPTFAALQAERVALEALERDILAAKDEAKRVQIPSPIEPATRSSHNDALVQGHIVTPATDVSGKGSGRWSVTEDTALGAARRSLDSRTNCVSGKLDYQAIQEEQQRQQAADERKFQQYEDFMRRASFK